MHEITIENLVLTARVAMVSQLGILYSLLLLEYFFMVQNQATSIQNPHINLVKQESLFLFFHLEKLGYTEVKGVAMLRVKPRTSVLCSSVSSCCIIIGARCGAGILFPNNSVQTKGLGPKLVPFFLEGFDCFLLQLSPRESYLITTYIFSLWYLQSTVQLLSLVPVHMLFPFHFDCSALN